MDEKEQKKSIQRRFELADQFLSSAKSLLERGDLRSAIDRAYYSMHHATQAALTFRGISKSKSHRFLISKFGEEFVKDGTLDKKYSRGLQSIFDARQDSTYEIYNVFGAEGTEEIINQAEEFVTKIKEMVGTSS